MRLRQQLLLLLIILGALTGCDNAARRDVIVGDEGVMETADGEANLTPTPRPTSPAPVGTTILVDGHLVAVNAPLPLGFAAGGRILSIHVEAGDHVTKGDLIASLDDTALQEAVTSAALQVAQAENNLAQLTVQADSEALDRSVMMAELGVAEAEANLAAARRSLDKLLEWEPEADRVALAEANLAAAQATLENAQSSDAVAGNSLTAARIAVEQAEAHLADAQKAYETAFDPGRDWEQYIDEPICYQGQGGSVPCTGPFYSTRIEDERKFAPLQVQAAEENLEIARAQYNLASAGVNNDTAVAANASVVSAEQALADLLAGPTEEQIESAQQTVQQMTLTLDRARINVEAARLQVTQAELSLQQAEFNLEQARQRLDDALLVAPWDGLVLSVEAAPGTLVGSGTPIFTLWDAERLEFHTSNLSERDLAYIEPGQSVRITLKAFSSHPIDGTVTRIVPQASGQVGDAATFTAVIDLDQTELMLMSGMTGRAEIERNPEG